MSRDHRSSTTSGPRRFGVASSMHDIGKVGIPNAVLCKPGSHRRGAARHPAPPRPRPPRPVGHPRPQRRRHPAENERPDRRVPPRRWDGRGYPEKLAGDTIPLPARIVAVADVYDALTSARVYKAAMTHAEASKVIDEGSGTQFDPAVVAAFRAASTAFDEARPGDDVRSGASCRSTPNGHRYCGRSPCSSRLRMALTPGPLSRSRRLQRRKQLLRS